MRFSVPVPKLLLTLASISIFSLSLLHADINNTKNFELTLSDNVTLTGGPNDLGPTGHFLLSYTDPDERYKLLFDWEIYVNGAPDAGVVTRTDPDNLRIDALRLSYMKVSSRFQYGLGIEILGELGGKAVQNTLHEAVGDAYVPAQYASATRATPTLNLAYRESVYHNLIDLYSTLRLPIIFKNGIIDFRASASHTFKALYFQELDATLGLNMDCKQYPDLPAFSGYPLRDFNTCTPEAQLSLNYGSFTFFWEAPLANNDIQNSYMGIRYRF